MDGKTDPSGDVQCAFKVPEVCNWQAQVTRYSLYRNSVQDSVVQMYVDVYADYVLHMYVY